MHPPNGEAAQAAFRAGLGDGPAGIRGEGERLLLAMRRLPGIGDAEVAFATGRVLRRIARLFDQSGARPEVVAQFRDNLVGAAIAARSARQRRGWALEDTIELFLELHRRGQGADAADLAAIRRHLMKAAGSSGRPVWFERAA